MKVNEIASETIGLNIMTADQLERIHSGTLIIFEHTGVKAFEKEALELLASSGAAVNGSLVKIPSWMVEEAIRTAPGAEKHTLDHFRQELLFPRVLNRKNYDAWLPDGGETFAGQTVKRLEKFYRGIISRLCL